MRQEIYKEKKIFCTDDFYKLISTINFMVTPCINNTEPSFITN